ncbi:MAG: hypothetical protein QXF17_06620 [Ignisphaera sp.]
MIEYVLAIALSIALAIDTIYRSEYISLILLIAAAVFLTLDLWLWMATFIAVVIIHRVAVYILRRSILEAVGLRYILIHILKPLIYLVVALILYPLLVSGKIIFPLMERWSSLVMYTVIVFLALALTIRPSLDTVASISKFVFTNLSSLTNTLAISAHIIGIATLFYSYIILKNLVLVPATLWLIYLVSRKRLPTFYATLFAILPYLLALILIEAIF